MPKINSDKSNIIKIEPSPFKSSSVKVQMQVLNVSGGSPKFTVGEDGKKNFKTQMVEPKNLSKLPGTVTEYSAQVGRNGLLKTGLDQLVKNKYINEDFYREGWEVLLKGKERVPLQFILEYKHGKPIGYYTNQVSGIRSSNSMQDAPFYQRPESRVTLRDGVTYLDLTRDIQEANYYMLREHNMIANSYEDLKNNPDATHYIANEQEQVKRETSKVRRSNKVGRCLEILFEETDNTIIDFCKALELRNGISSKDDAYNALDSYVKTNENSYQEFMDMYKMWDNTATRETFMGYVELFDFLSTPGLITKRNNKYFWVQPAPAGGGKQQPWEWKSKIEVVEKFLVDPRYREEVEILRTLFTAKTRYKLD